jgi:hypothetical protein
MTENQQRPATPGPIQPGANQPGPIQPGANQPGPNQPGAIRPSAFQPSARRQARALLVPLLISAVIPVLAYVLLRPHVHSDLTALVIGTAIPTVYTAAMLVWRSRLDPVGVFAVACFCVGLLLVYATGGNELVFKIREDLWTGPLGLACLISVAVRKPFYLLALQLAARRSPQLRERTASPGLRHRANVVTAAVGLILLVHAAVLVVLALTTSTTTFLAVSKPITWAIVGGGVGGLVLWLRHQVYGTWHGPRVPMTAGPGGAARREEGAPQGNTYQQPERPTRGN